MFQLLRTLFAFSLGSFTVKLFTSLGIGFAGYSIISVFINDAFQYMQTVYSGLPSDVIGILSISGVPEGLSILGSAILTAAAIHSARVVFAKR